jgi:hypothetical protein
LLHVADLPTVSTKPCEHLRWLIMSSGHKANWQSRRY